MRITKTTTRRTFATTFAGAGLALTAVPRNLHLSAQETPSASPQASPVTAGGMTGIGTRRTDWEAVAGEGEPSGDWTVYTSPADGSTPVIVGYTEDVISFMEYDLSAAGDQGISTDDADALVAAAVPQDAMPGETFFVGPNGETAGAYQSRLYADPTLGDVIADATGVMVIQMTINSGINPDPSQVTGIGGITITTNNAPDVDLPITGDPGGIGIGRDQWIAAYGEPPEADYEVETYPGAGPTGMDVTVTYLPQDDTIQAIAANGDALDLGAATQVSVLEFSGASVPGDGSLLQHFYFPPTENGPLALRAMTIDSASAQQALHFKGSILVLLHERPDDPKPMVPRLDLVIPGE